jgi:hypothetical protein
MHKRVELPFYKSTSPSRGVQWMKQLLVGARAMQKGVQWMKQLLVGARAMQKLREKNDLVANVVHLNLMS